jgi:glycosyltransferase involved in cell wall biosynthesis/cellulose synthase/poly-beta-1,6-N-acetylglucosamine synthase-like glycosyltransferase
VSLLFQIPVSLLQILPGIFLVFPALLQLIARIKGYAKSTPDFNPTSNFGLIITAYGDAEISIPLIDSLLKQRYQNFVIYLVADSCDTSNINFSDDRLVILEPAQKLGGKVKSILYAMDRYVTEHAYTIVFDPDNLAHPDYLGHMNNYFNKGYVAVQGQRTAKNLDTIYACLDAMGEAYNNCTSRRVPFTIGSSATIAGSGMGVETIRYKAILEKALTDSNNTVIVAEDKILQSALVLDGFQIAYNTEALVYDEKVSTDGQVQRQRARWINSYFKYFVLNKTLIKRSLKTFNLNQIIYSIIVVYPPMFIMVGFALLGGFLQLILDYTLAWPVFLCLVIFTLNFLYSLKVMNAPRPIWLSLWGIPLFVKKQIAATLNIKQSNKDFLTTTHDRFFTIDEVLYAEKMGWTIPVKKASAPVKILQVIRQGSFGGGETYLNTLIHQLDSSEHESIVVAFTDGEMIKRLNSSGYKSYVIAYKGFFHLGLVKRIYQILKAEEIELVHAHGTKACLNALCAALIAGVKVVYTVHGWSFHDGQSSLYFKARKFVERWLVKNVDKTIVVSNSNLNDAKGFDGDFTVIQNGIDTIRFNPNNVIGVNRGHYQLDNSDFIIASIARLTHQKGPLVLIQAFSDIVKVIPNAKLLFVGGGELEEAAKAEVVNLKLEGKVRFADFSGSVAEIYKTIDLFVLPSLWEGFSLSLLEALAMECPVICSDYPSNTEIVKHKETGLVFPVSDAKALANVIIWAHNNPESVAQYVKTAAEIVRNNYDFSRVLHDNQLVYREMTRLVQPISKELSPVHV